MALFLIGLLLSDMENAKDWGVHHDKRPLEVLRNMSLTLKIPIYVVLLMTIYFANNDKYISDEQPGSNFKAFGAVALILLALISTSF